MTNQELKEIEARLAAATPGPWDWGSLPEAGKEGLRVYKPVPFSVGATIAQLRKTDSKDAEFIAHAPGDIRRLRDELYKTRDLMMRAERLFILNKKKAELFERKYIEQRNEVKRLRKENEKLIQSREAALRIFQEVLEGEKQSTEQVIYDRGTNIPEELEELEHETEQTLLKFKSALGMAD
jgi:hypothetical protein